MVLKKSIKAFFLFTASQVKKRALQSKLWSFNLCRENKDKKSLVLVAYFTHSILHDINALNVN
jgi:hypothetical protein